MPQRAESQIGLSDRDVQPVRLDLADDFGSDKKVGILIARLGTGLIEHLSLFFVERSLYYPPLDLFPIASQVEDGGHFAFMTDLEGVPRLPICSSCKLTEVFSVDSSNSVEVLNGRKCGYGSATVLECFQFGYSEDLL